MNLPAPLFADAADVIKAVLSLMFVFFWIASQFLGEKKKAKQQAPKPKLRPQPANQPQQPRPGVQPAGAPPPRRQAGDPLADEIEQFLRRAAGKKDPNQPERVEVLVPPKSDRGERKIGAPLQPMARQTDSPYASASEVDDGGSVASHVEKHISRSAHTERISHLGEVIGGSDERMDSEIHAKFDHSVGRLTQFEPRRAHGHIAAAPSPFAVSIVQMFRDPVSIQKAIVLNEVLTRPVDRW